MTVKELRKAIKEQTSEVNKRLSAYYESGSKSGLVEKQIGYLREVSGTSSKSAFIAGRASAKNKAQLQAQLYELESFLKHDLLTPAGLKAQEERDKRAYRSFKKNRATNISYENWRKLVTIFGATSDKLLNQYGGSNETQTAILKAIKSGRSTTEIIKVLEQTEKANRKKGYNPQQYLQDFEKALGLK